MYQAFSVLLHDLWLKTLVKEVPCLVHLSLASLTLSCSKYIIKQDITSVKFDSEKFDSVNKYCTIVVFACMHVLS